MIKVGTDNDRSYVKRQTFDTGEMGHTGSVE